jgi:hypothetical protein
MHAIKTTRLGNTKETVMEMSRNTEISWKVWKHNHIKFIPKQIWRFCWHRICFASFWYSDEKFVSPSLIQSQSSIYSLILRNLWIKTPIHTNMYTKNTLKMLKQSNTLRRSKASEFVLCFKNVILNFYLIFKFGLMFPKFRIYLALDFFNINLAETETWDA